MMTGRGQVTIGLAIPTMSTPTASHFTHCGSYIAWLEEFQYRMFEIAAAPASDPRKITTETNIWIRRRIGGLSVRPVAGRCQRFHGKGKSSSRDVSCVSCAAETIGHQFLEQLYQAAQRLKPEQVEELAQRAVAGIPETP